MMNTKLLLLAAAAITFLGIAAGVLYFTDQPSLRGSVIEPPMAAPELELIDFDGNPYTLSDNPGKIRLVFFGYTNCPDTCPLTMAKLRLAMDTLGEDAKRATVVLITTDPNRDTPEALREYLRRFDPSFVGLTGSREQLAPVWQAYGVAVRDGGVTHSNYIYVIDTSGQLVETLLADATPAVIVGDVRALLRQD